MLMFLRKETLAKENVNVYNKMKKGQFWYADFVVGLLVIAFITVLFARAVVDVPEKESGIRLLHQDAITIASLLMSPGVDSANWINGQGKIGLVQNGKINYLWFNDFISLITKTNPDGYQKARQLFGTNYDFSVYFQKKDASILGNKAYGGMADVGQLQNLEAENIVRVNRVVYFDETGDNIGEVYTMHVVVWDLGTEKRTSKKVCENANNCGLCNVLGIFIPDYLAGCRSEHGLCNLPYPAKDPAKCPV